MTGCPSQDELGRLLSDLADSEVEGHVEGCPDCQDRLARLIGGPESDCRWRRQAVDVGLPTADAHFLDRLGRHPPGGIDVPPNRGAGAASPVDPRPFETTVREPAAF